MNRHLLAVLLVALPLIALADARLELDTGHCHAPWSEANSDLEHKYHCEIFSSQQTDGSYHAESITSWSEYGDLHRPAGAAYDPDTGIAEVTTRCGTTAGTFIDDDGNVFTTGNCWVILSYTRDRRDYRTHITALVRMRAATAATAAAADAAVSAGTSAAVRGY